MKRSEAYAHKMLNDRSIKKPDGTYEKHVLEMAFESGEKVNSGATKIIEQLQKELVMDGTGFFAKLHSKELFDKVKNFKVEKI